jgi:sugar phosphate isomerase/epimerase
MSAEIAVMMYTVDALLDGHLDETLDRIASIGFVGIETYGLHGHSASAYKKAADAAGLKIISSHAPFPAGADAARILDEYSELGVDTLAWSLEREEFDTPAAITAGVVRVNDGVENAAQYGMRIAYHNHFAEFENIFGGRRAYELLIDQLDPRAVLELDMYWTQLGGIAPAEILNGLGNRVPFVHVKDGPVTSYEDDVMVPVGTGSIDMRSALSANDAVRWHIVELERLHINVFDALQQSYDFMVGQSLSKGLA